MRNEATLFEQCEREPVKVLPEHDKTVQAKTRVFCVELLDSHDLVGSCAPYLEHFGAVNAQVRSAVNIALASFRMPDEVELMVPWINYHDTLAVNTLSRMLNDHQRIFYMKANPDMMRLFTCFIDFDVDSNMIIDVLSPRQPYGKEDLRNSAPVPQFEFEAATEAFASESSSASAPASASASASTPATRKFFIL